MEKYLMHHGIKGQEWGITHGPPYPINDRGETRIKAGSGKVHRLSIRDESASRGHAYVTFLKSDNEHYKGFFGMRLHAGPANWNKKVYQYEFDNKDLVSPSKQKRVETFMSLYKKDPILRKELKQYYNKETRGSHRKEIHGSKKRGNFDTFTVEQKYNTFARSLGSKNSYIRDTYFKELSKKGYNFVIDDLDAGKFGKQPAIIFNRETSLVNKGKKAISKKESFKILNKEGAFINEYKEKQNGRK